MAQNHQGEKFDLPVNKLKIDTQNFVGRKTFLILFNYLTNQVSSYLTSKLFNVHLKKLKHKKLKKSLKSDNVYIISIKTVINMMSFVQVNILHTFLFYFNYHIITYCIK